ncbi:hypothetical protein PGTUg99_007482 [Puccinia graminis f. sp. tritici]|uniref:Uncharacterized protein n=1 Tax=Puccinia graminis f. sp. tritici TaxID=56615 RepID=A0A5B0PVY9_PUCGR|nr:hypothetical protein PGTUg99_007482 [Puccinia graminis f. sp. tritici]
MSHSPIDLLRKLHIQPKRLPFTHDAVYTQDNRIVETLVAPCLDKYGHGVAEGQAYEIHGLITRDDLCGTTWEFNPLLLDCTATRDQDMREDALQVMGCGQVKSVSKVMNPSAPTGSYHQILVNHQPTIQLVVGTSLQDLGLNSNDLIGLNLNFCGCFVGEEIETGTLKLLVRNNLLSQP